MRSTVTELAGAHKTSENRSFSVASLCLPITCWAPSAESLSSIASRYSRRTRWLLFKSILPMLCIYNVQTMIVLTMTFLTFTGGQISASTSFNSRPRPRPRPLQIGLETETRSRDLTSLTSSPGTAMCYETVGLRTRPVSDEKISLGLNLQVWWCCVVKHLVTLFVIMILKGNNFSSTIYRLGDTSVLGTPLLRGDQQWRLLT